MNPISEYSPSNPAVILDLAAEHGLKLLAETLSLNESGLDFRVAYAEDNSGQSWVLRLPRRQDVLATASREHQILTALKAHLPVAIPDWQIYSEQLIAYPLLKGQPACLVDASGLPVWAFDLQNPPSTYLQSVAESLAALHQLSPEILAATGAPVLNGEQAREKLNHEIQQTRELLNVPEQIWQRWQNWLNHDVLWQQTSTIIHGDLHPGHQLLDSDSQLTGLIDWTEAAVGDPALDFAAHYGLFGEDALDKLLKHYQQVGGTVSEHLKTQIQARWLASPINLAVYAKRTGQNDYLAIAQTLLDAQLSKS